MAEIWFWQRIVSPHMAGLATALARQGCTVTYIAEQGLSPDRVKLGWQTPDMHGVRLLFAVNSTVRDALVQEASPESVHICQGIRGNGAVSMVQIALARRGLRQWAVMETIDDSGLLGIIKRLEYGRLFRCKGHYLEGVLAIGHRTERWLKARGMLADRVFPFAYFLPDVNQHELIQPRVPGPFRFLFVGRFDNNKRLDWLIYSLKALGECEFELQVGGSGPQEKQLRLMAEHALNGRVHWLGKLPQDEVPRLMQQADCLVLPSQHDGWGAVISEAMMVGTPVVCSDTCGAAGVVIASGIGGVFSSNKSKELQEQLFNQLNSGPINMQDRRHLAIWAAALGAEAGAQYLIKILDYAITGGSRPTPPWH